MAVTDFNNKLYIKAFKFKLCRYIFVAKLQLTVGTADVTHISQNYFIARNYFSL